MTSAIHRIPCLLSRHRRSALLSAVVLLVFAVGLLAPMSQTAQAQSNSLFAEAAGDRARITFLWDGPVAFSANIVSGVLIVQFDRPWTGSLGGVPGAANPWVAGVASTSDQRTVTFPLRGNYTLRNLSSGVAVVLELVGPPAVAAAPAQPAPPPAPAARPAQPSPQAAAPSPSSAAPLTVRTGEHADYFRVVFDWPRQVPYTVTEQGGNAVVRFDAAAQVDLERLRQRFPDRFAAGQLSSSGGGSALQMVLPGGGGGVRHFRSGNSIAIDLRYGSAAVTAASPQASTETSPAGSGGAAGSQLAQATAAPAPAAPADPTDVPPPRESRNAAPTSPPSTTPAPAPDAAAAPAPASDQTPSSPPAPAVAADGSVPPPRPDGRVQPPPEQTETAAPEGPSGVGPQRVAQEATPVETDPADAEPVPSVLGATDNPAENSPVEGLERLAASRQDVPERQYDREIYSMSFSWDRPVAAAAFRRAGYLWVVFSAWQEVDMRVLRVTAGEALLFAEQVDIGRDATAVRMVVDPIFSPSFRREGLLWIMDLQRGPMRPDVPIAVTPQPQSPAGPRLYLSVAEGGDAITFNDPEVGDPLIVVPVVPLGQGIFPERRLPDLTLPVTAQGILIEPKTDDLQVIPSRQGVEISSAAGLRFTTDADRLLAMSGLGADDGLSSIFNIPAWRGNPQQHFSTRRAQALEAVSIAPRSRRNDARLELARFYFANGYAPEALGVLRTILADGGEGFLNRPSFRAVRGGSNLLMGRYRDAVDDLSHPGLADVDEAAFWRAAGQVRIGNPAIQASILDSTGGVITDYPRDVRRKMAFIAAEGAIAAADDLAAHNFLEAAASAVTTAGHQAQLLYLEGLLNESTGAFEDALSSWEESVSMNSQKWSAFSQLKILEMNLSLDRITEAELIAGLERLRFQWRGDDFEYDLLRRLSNLHLDSGDFGASLRLLKLAATYFRHRPEIGEVTDQMSEVFEDLFLRGAADRMSDVRAIALYDEFRELTPPGEKGDEMIRRLADRLAKVDLLEQAGVLLDRQLSTRLTEPGEERANVGARLGLIYLFDDRPQDALNTLQATESGGLPEELGVHRNQLEARALASLGRPNDAIARLEGDNSRDANILRADIYWQAANWPMVARALSVLVPTPSRGVTLEAEDAMRATDWAMALSLAGDEPQVTLLRRRYLEAMRGTDYFDAFDLYTTPGARDLVDYRKINQQVAQAEAFRSYLSVYRQRLKDDRLEEGRQQGDRLNAIN